MIVAVTLITEAKKNWEQYKCLLTGKWIKTKFSHMLEYFYIIH